MAGCASAAAKLSASLGANGFATTLSRFLIFIKTFSGS
jgi:hypothetical protein